MSYNNLILTFAITICTILTGCDGCDRTPSDDLKEDVPFYQEYYVSYDKNDNETYAAGKFKSRDKTGGALELSGADKLLINGEETTFSKVTVRHFKSLNSLTEVTYTLTKDNSTSINNTVSVNDINNISAEFPASLTSLSKSTGSSFSWIGADYNSSQYISFNIYGTDNTGSSKTVTINIDSKQVNITPSDIKDFNQGEKVELTLRRSYEKALQQSDQNAGGFIDITYEVKKEVTIN